MLTRNVPAHGRLHKGERHVRFMKIMTCIS